MAEIKPLQGYRYNPIKANDLTSVTAPAYDTADSLDYEKYYHKHKYNIIRLDAGKEYPTDDSEDNKYSRAKLTLKDWLNNKVLIPEEKPVIYRHQQEYTVNGEKRIRRGFTCRVKIEPIEKGTVLPHQQTLPEVTEDRLQLITACNANITPVLGLYNDAGHKIEEILENAVERIPDVDFVDDQGITHRMWVVKDEGTINEVQHSMERYKIFIANGHHQYAAALKYRQEQRQALGITNESSEKPFDYIMMTLVNLYQPAIEIQPIHRLVKGIKKFNLKKIINDISEEFDVKEFAVDLNGGNIDEFLNQAYNRGGFDRGMGIDHRRAFGMYAGNGQGFVITLESESAMDRLMPREKSLAWQGLDVSVLHTAILEKILGIDGEKGNGTIDYLREEKEVLKMVNSSEYQLSFFMNPVLLDEFSAVAIGGEKMPPKSTYFHPKLTSGLVINKF
ncbi:MAG: DUF1015 domain-containing protein [Firmicutes bacterium]|nr:DUF1015 domain-containing protein [Bacillota bacterium]